MKKIIGILLALLMLVSTGAAAFAAGTGPAKQYRTAKFRIPDTEGIRFVQELKVGINLGNTFDAHSEGLDDEMDYETVWCGVKTTPELIAAIKEAGFNTVRIPVSWHDHITDAENHTISTQWLERVNEVVDYCIAQDMYVILNIHHDDGKSCVYPSKAYSAQSVKYIRAVWSQLAERFKDYDEHLLFESLNEPRLVGCIYEWLLMPISPSCMDAVRQINSFNKAFVETVRASGGNNETRWLLCPGYDASPAGVTDPGFRLPKDKHVIVAVHAYTPDPFAHQARGPAKWSSKNLLDTAQITLFMDELYCRYISKGIPVLIDEFGAVAKTGNLASRTDYAGFYVANARARGMSCLWWDNNIASGDGERFGLIDRASLRWVYPDIVSALVNYS